MTQGQVIFYDFGHCNDFLQARKQDISDSASGLGALAPYRPLFSAFGQEAMETGALTLGQFDTGLVYLFVPAGVTREVAPAAHKVARAKAVELMQVKSSPMIFDMRAAQSMDPPLSDQAHYENWMPAELLDLVETGELEIQLLVNTHAFFEDIISPALQQNGFTTPDEYITAAKSGFIRVRHEDAPGKGYKLPWVKWLREMLTGGYSMAYPMACMGAYLQKMQQAIAAGPASQA